MTKQEKFEIALKERIAEFLYYVDDEGPVEAFKFQNLWEIAIEGSPENVAAQIVADAKREAGL